MHTALKILHNVSKAVITPLDFLTMILTSKV